MNMRGVAGEQHPRNISPPARTVTSSADGSNASTPKPRRISAPIATARSAAIRAAGTALGERPIGRRGRVTGTYEKSITGVPYILAYALGPLPGGDEAIFILHVIHTARDWPEDGWPGK
jgi:toxin ParE1/3/4